ncbi:MAG: alpha-L-rhamnosidase N-terminal domain-containing protein, partial [Phycisphaeraceae bacterium]|nr:alpha-L-rhamnosidase N-terminal domain-containing protein [Phycisphaeraceae bacterium]
MLLLTVMSVLMLCLCAGETLAVASDLPNESPVPIANAQWITADRPDTAAGTAQQTRSPGVHVSGSDRSPDARAVPLPIFRKSFMVKDGLISKAELVICGLGHFELSINGTRVGDHFLDPPWSDYADTCYTVRFDVA